VIDATSPEAPVLARVDVDGLNPIHNKRPLGARIAAVAFLPSKNVGYVEPVVACHQQSPSPALLRSVANFAPIKIIPNP
jgi:hypothetical protein